MYGSPGLCVLCGYFENTGLCSGTSDLFPSPVWIFLINMTCLWFYGIHKIVTEQNIFRYLVLSLYCQQGDNEPEFPGETISCSVEEVLWTATAVIMSRPGQFPRVTIHWVSWAASRWEITGDLDNILLLGHIYTYFFSIVNICYSWNEKDSFQWLVPRKSW